MTDSNTPAVGGDLIAVPREMIERAYKCASFHTPLGQEPNRNTLAVDLYNALERLTPHAAEDVIERAKKVAYDALRPLLYPRKVGELSAGNGNNVRLHADEVIECLAAASLLRAGGSDKPVAWRWMNVSDEYSYTENNKILAPGLENEVEVQALYLHPARPTSGDAGVIEAWQYRTKASDGSGWSMWSNTTEQHVESIKEKGFSDAGFRAEVRPLYAATPTWAQAFRAAAKYADEKSEDNSDADTPYDSGAGSMGYSLACRAIAKGLNEKADKIELGKILSEALVLPASVGQVDECPDCSGSGYQMYSRCCEQPTKSGECCGNPQPDRTACDTCGGAGRFPASIPAPVVDREAVIEKTAKRFPMTLDPDHARDVVDFILALLPAGTGDAEAGELTDDQIRLMREIAQAERATGNWVRKPTAPPADREGK